MMYPEKWRALQQFLDTARNRPKLLEIVSALMSRSAGVTIE